MGHWKKTYICVSQRDLSSKEKNILFVNSNVVLYGYSIWLLYQDGKEKNNSLCSFVPGDATAVPCWEIWALAC